MNRFRRVNFLAVFVGPAVENVARFFWVRNSIFNSVAVIDDIFFAVNTDDNLIAEAIVSYESKGIFFDCGSLNASSDKSSGESDDNDSSNLACSLMILCKDDDADNEDDDRDRKNGKASTEAIASVRSNDHFFRLVDVSELNTKLDIRTLGTRIQIGCGFVLSSKDEF